jgi:hypothetical protein
MSHHRNRRSWLALVLLAVTFSVWALGCNQGEGDRCQRSKDCPSPLVCNLATLTCSTDNSSGQIDAGTADGPPPDAAVDAPPDVPPDI